MRMNGCTPLPPLGRDIDVAVGEEGWSMGSSSIDVHLSVTGED